MDVALSRWRGSSIEPDQPDEVVSEISQADFNAGAHQADGTDEKSELAFLGGEDMFDARAYPGAGGVARAMCAGIFLPRGFFRWNCGLSPRRSSKARFATER